MSHYTIEKPKLFTIVLFGISILTSIFYILCISRKKSFNLALAKPKNQKANLNSPKRRKKSKDDGLGEMLYTKKRTTLDEFEERLVKHRKYVDRTSAEHLSDAKSDKFENRGPLKIDKYSTEIMTKPSEEEEVKLKKQKEIIFDKVFYDPSGNEQFEIGTSVEEIESIREDKTQLETVNCPPVVKNLTSSNEKVTTTSAEK